MQLTFVFCGYRLNKFPAFMSLRKKHVFEKDGFLKIYSFGLKIMKRIYVTCQTGKDGRSAEDLPRANNFLCALVRAKAFPCA